jgi:bifunctional oligoribonuclease and PAP phosphatase NrnA
MPLDWSPFVELVSRHQRFLLMTHVRPDADALGSQLALAEALESKGKKARVVIASNLPPRYKFMDPEGRIERFGPPDERFRDIDAIIILDTGTWNQIGDFGSFMRSLMVEKMVIDHHRTQDDLGAKQLVDVTAEATGRLVYEAFGVLNVALTKSAASNIFAALATDTGWFRHSSTAPRTLLLAEELMRAGANPTEIYDAIYEQSSLAKLKLIGRALESMQVVADGKIAYVEIHQADFPLTGAIPADTEDLINYPRSVEGVEVALIFIEQANGSTKISFRSRARVDVDKIAEKFNGGGHRLASGATVPLTLKEAKRQVLDAVIAALPTS